jgi:parallel beta-helix repeat protein
MKKTIALGIVFLLVFMSFTSISGIQIDKNTINPSYKGDILYVGGSGEGNYSSIQDAIDDAFYGDTVYVYNGTYYEQITIYKSINLIGEDKNSTIIDENGITVNIQTHNATLTRFTIQNGSQYTLHIDSDSSNNKIIGNIIINRYDRPTSHMGIWLDYNSINNTISNNEIEMFYVSGISVNGDYNTITDNTIKNNRRRGVCISGNFNNINKNNIYKNDEIGINIWADNNLISENTIMDNGNDGIYIYNDENTISKNNIFNHTNGIYIKSYSKNNYIFENLITNNTYGIKATSSTDNLIYHNNFHQNMVNAGGSGNNKWDAGYPSGGNYWDDYNGTDENGDGIGDVPYYISNGINCDRYPFISSDGWFEYGGWWDYDWRYKKQLYITNSTSCYQMVIRVWKEDGHDNSDIGDIDCEDHCKTDFSDIRFIDANQSTLLPYWIEKVGTTNGDHYARIWVKINGNNLIYMYYGNPNAIDKSSGTDTFQYFDDWTKDNTDEWVYGNPTINHHHWWAESETFTTYRSLVSNSMLKNWNVGKQNWVVLGWTQDNTSDWCEVDHIVIQWRMNESDGATDEIVPVRLQVRYGNNTDTTVITKVKKPDPNHKLSIKLCYLPDKVTYAWKDLDDDSVLASGYIDNPLVVPPPENLKYLLHAELDLEDGIWSYLPPTYLNWGNKPIGGGCEWLTDYWFVKNLSYPEPTWEFYGVEQELISIVYVDDDFNESTPGWCYDHFDNIKDGINGVVEGGTVYVYNGVYYENLVLDKIIDLKGENKEKTVIDGMKKESVLFVENCQFNISSLTLRNGNKHSYGFEVRYNEYVSTIKDCIIFGSFMGIHIEDSSNILIHDCYIFDNLEGVYLINGDYCEIYNCSFSNRQGGVSINLESEFNNVIDCSMTGNMTGGSNGISIYCDNNNVIGCNISDEFDGIKIWGSNNKIENCIISNNRGRGIEFGRGNNNLIKDIIISNNGFSSNQYFGIEIFEGVNNVFEGCQILNNCDGGIYISWTSWGNSIINSTIANNGHESTYYGLGIICGSKNYIYLNNFIDNRIQAYDIDSNSHWDNGEFGNYWSDYTGEDNDYDGIGDTPYYLYRESNLDNYPLIVPYKDGPSVKITTPQNGYVYLRNLKLFPFRTTLILGNIKIKAMIVNYDDDDIMIEKVEFYVDGRLRWVDKQAPYGWRWRLSSPFKHYHTVSVVAYDSSGNTACDKQDLWRFF